VIALLAGPFGRPLFYAAAVLAALVVLWGVWSSVRDSGVQQQRAADTRAELRDAEVSHAVDGETRAVGPAGVTAGLRPWTRD